MAVPAGLQAAVEAGKLYVSGAVVKDTATNLIVAHLQPTTALSRMFGSMNPAALALDAGGDVLQSYQLLRIERLLDSVKIISSIGAAASVLNLGVSLGGFALVLAAMKKTDAKLDAVSAAIEKLGRREDAKLVAAVRVALERAEDAFALPADERRERWLRCDERLHELTGLLVELLDKAGLPLDITEGRSPLPADQAAKRLTDPELIQLLVYLLTVQRAHVETLLCLGRPALAARAAGRVAAWLTNLPKDARAIAVARVAGRPLSASQIERIASEAAALGQWVASAETAAQQQALICDRLDADKVDTLEYVLEVRDTKEPKLLMYSHSNGTSFG
jgi:hypothetical protein